MFFYSNFKREGSLDAEFNSASNEYPHSILLTDPLPQKQEIPEKNVMMMSSSHFFRYFLCFLGSGVYQKYGVWVLIGCGIKFHIQRALPLEI